MITKLKSFFFFILLIILIFLLTGCRSSKLEAKKLNLEQYNKHVDYLLMQYEKNKEEANKIETQVIEGIFSGEIVANSISSTCALEINNSISIVKSQIISYVNYLVDIELNTLSAGFAEENSGLSNPVKNEELLRELKLNELQDNIECYYFLNTTDGVLEQSFIIESFNGNHILLSFYWLDGDCFDVGYTITGGVN